MQHVGRQPVGGGCGGCVGGTKTVGIAFFVGMITAVGFRVAAVVGRAVEVLDGVPVIVAVAVSVNVGDAVSIARNVGVSAIGVKVSVGLGVNVSVGESIMTFNGLVGSRVDSVAVGDEQPATNANARISKT